MKNPYLKKGFTLPEAIIAAAVLTIAVVSLIQVFPVGIRTSSQSRKVTIATNLAQSAIEQSSSRTYENIVSILKARVNTDPNSSFYQFFSEINVAYVDTGLNEVPQDTGLKKITATVSWTEQGEGKQVQIPTLISDK